MINAWGISDDDFLKNVVILLQDKLKDLTDLTWPPRPNHLEGPSDPPDELIKFLTWLRHPSRKPGDCTIKDSCIIAIGDLLFGMYREKMNLVNSSEYFNTNQKLYIFLFGPRYQ